MIEHVDETAAKVVLAIRPGDSIRRVAQKVGGSYSWVYEWVERLEDAGIVRRDDGLYVDDHGVRSRYLELVAAIARSVEPTIEEGYVLPHFAGLPFANARLDAVYVWTHGGYQVARGHDDYPIFLRVRDRDVEQWIAFFDELGVPSAVGERVDPTEFDGAVSYALFPTTGELDPEWVDGNPVVSLDETVDHMLEHRVNYEPALEVIAEEYDRELDVSLGETSQRS